MHDPQDSKKAGYETSDMRTSVIVIFASALFVLMVAGVVAALIVLRGFDRSRVPEVPPSALASEVTQIPNPPHLQQDPVAERKQILAEAAAQLGSYGIVSDNPQMKRAHIPIERAMELLVSGKAPYRQRPADATTGANTAPQPEG